MLGNYNILCHFARLCRASPTPSHQNNFSLTQNSKFLADCTKLHHLCSLPPPQSSAGGADGFREEQVAFSVDGGTEPIQFPSLCDRDVTTVTDRALVIFIPRFKHRRFSGTAAADSILSCGFLAFRSDFCAGRAGALLSLRRSVEERKDRIDRVVSADFRRDCY